MNFQHKQNLMIMYIPCPCRIGARTKLSYPTSPSCSSGGIPPEPQWFTE